MLGFGKLPQGYFVRAVNYPKGILLCNTKIPDEKVEVSRINAGKKQTLETITSEEARLLARCLRNEEKHGLRE